MNIVLTIKLCEPELINLSFRNWIKNVNFNKNFIRVHFRLRIIQKEQFQDRVMWIPHFGGGPLFSEPLSALALSVEYRSIPWVEGRPIRSPIKCVDMESPTVCNIRHLYLQVSPDAVTKIEVRMSKKKKKIRAYAVSIGTWFTRSFTRGPARTRNRECDAVSFVLGFYEKNSMGHFSSDKSDCLHLISRGLLVWALHFSCFIHLSLKKKIFHLMPKRTSILCN